MKLPAVITRLFKRNYNAASGSPRWPAWATLSAPVAQTHAAAHLAGSRAAFAVGSTPMAASLASVYTDALFPDAPSVKLVNSNRDVEQSFANWLAANTAALRTLVRSQFVNGEGLARMTVDRNGELRLQVLNNEQLDRSISRDLENGGRIIAGVELDAADNVVAYHILPDAMDQAFTTIAPARRIPADDIIHFFEQKVAGQRRGISELSPVLTRLHELEKLSDALLARASTAALFGGFITDASGTAFGDASAKPPEADLSLEPGALRVLPVGTDIRFPTMPDNADAPGLLKSMQRDICAGVGIPYTLATGDLSDTNYSSGKLGMEAFKRRIKATRASLLIPLVIEPLYRRWALLRLLNGQAVSVGSATFLFPDWASIEPKKEAEADVILLNAGLRSRAEIISARGRDIQDVDAEIAADTFVPKALPSASQTQETEND
ncbi:phage portal protein [Bradyrhizobium sp. C-145]|uniref:phage portal protein n=1 Tax=Bradyrhizobium sp. C-145 TaxID=574727 RepID=UPI00201B5489|nr:phage portal protein [Bradyrhizobium sp. C-145]UQR67355.1 phage portal protein [Bradyrhizobium sp. C-145]